MLAHPTKGISEVLDRFANQNFTCEYKYDGERGQIHKLPDGTVKIYSRNSEDNTSKYPDIIKMLPEVMAEGTTDFVLDCEVVAYDRETKKILPFQVLSTRKRKEADEGEIKVQVCLFAFDMLYFNGEALIKKPLKERRDQMRKSFNEVEGTFMFATCRDASDTEEILAFLNESVAASCEGLMVKTLDAGGPGSTYEPDKRSHKWLKVKKDYIKGMTDRSVAHSVARRFEHPSSSQFGFEANLRIGHDSIAHCSFRASNPSDENPKSLLSHSHWCPILISLRSPNAEQL